MPLVHPVSPPCQWSCRAITRLQWTGDPLRAIMSHFVTSPNTNIPGCTMVSDKSDFSYKIRHCTHPTDTNGYRFFSLSLSFFVFGILTGLMCSRSCNWWDLPGIVCGCEDRCKLRAPHARMYRMIAFMRDYDDVDSDNRGY